MDLLIDLLVRSIAACRVVVSDNGNLLGSLALAGLAGGLTHCVGMCGPFVLSQVSARFEALPAARMTEFHRLAGAALIPYHLGRMVTYCVLGAVAGGAAGQITQIPALSWLTALLLTVAALLFLGYGLRRLGVHWWPGAGTVSAASGETAWSRWVTGVAGALFARPLGLRGFALGMLLGGIPCGLLYAALSAAAAIGSAVGGALAMAVFTLATVPALLGVAVLGHLVAQTWQNLVVRLAPLLMILNALVLGALAVSRLLP